MVVASVREWHEELGWGVLDSSETHVVELDWERGWQDGFDFRAVAVKRL